MIRLLDNTHVYVHAIIDNYSRRILAWCADKSFRTDATVELLNAEAKGLGDQRPQVFMDSGVENTNSAVTGLVDAGTIKRVLAQVDVQYSNSMIESWWRVLKHQWLYINTLDTLENVQRLIAFFVEQHNSVIPHSAFEGQTPDEMYFGKGDGIPEKLKSAASLARKTRLETNRASHCKSCRDGPIVVELEKT
jgi:putative transposase